MASYTKESSAPNLDSANAGLSFGDRATVPDGVDKNAASLNIQDQVLLQALHDFIVPLIRGRNNAIQMDLGPEAGNLLIALREFISSIAVRSAPKMIEVSLGEDSTQIEDTLDDEGQESDYERESSSAEADSDATNEEKSEDQGKPEATFQEKLLRELREQVFNKMPIRLLAFEPHGTSLRIALLEREDVHAQLVSVLREEKKKEGQTESEAIERLIFQSTRYAILSHTWLRTATGEVTYSDWNKGLFDANNMGYQKLVNFCKTTWKYGLTFGWMDTVCINKDSSSELDESIRSMYNWYQRANVCIIYLAETETLQSMHNDPWFTRGWTLQELFAPEIIIFYNTDWMRLVENSRNDKSNTKIVTQIKRATTISKHELYAIRDAPISRRMELAAKRQVTREEDMAYSLMGIFDVSIVTAYGEGTGRAFYRLLQEILATTYRDIMDIFNWAGTDLYQPHNSSILPASPQHYIDRSTIVSKVMSMPPMEPLTLTHLGLRIPVILMPAISSKGPTFQYSPIGDYRATVDISPIDSWYTYLSNTHHLLDKHISGPDGARDDLTQITFAVLNFTGEKASTIRISKFCLAMVLECSEDAGRVSASGRIGVIRTAAPIVFALENENNDDENERGYQVKIDKLSIHGMQLVTLYL